LERKDDFQVIESRPPSPDKHAEVNNHPEITSRTSTQGVKFFFDISKIVGFNSFVDEFRLL
jgi:hypothetical protein